MNAKLVEYSSRGWKIFPINPTTKIPAIKGNLINASSDLAQIALWLKKFPGCNWGLSLAQSGLVAVDIDKKGLNYWEALVEKHGEPETLIQNSGSGIGRHYVFEAKLAQKYRGKIIDGIDVKHNGYIVVEPSRHASGNQYTWRETTLKNPNLPPDWLNELIEKNPEQHGRSSKVYKFGDNFYPKLIEQLKEKTFGYDEWMRIGMALYSAFDGSDEGLAHYLNLTNGVNFTPGDDEKAQAKWESFAGTEISPGTLVYIARSLGVEVPSPVFEDDKARFREEMEREREESSSRQEWETDKLGRLYTWNHEFMVSEINKMGFAVMTAENEGSIIRHWKDENGTLKVKSLQYLNFKTTLAPYNLKTFVGEDAKLVPAADVWLKNDGRKTFTEIVFRPPELAPKGSLNLWSEIPCEKVEGDITPILNFFENVLCTGNKEKANYLIQWLAHLVQKPGEKCVIVPVMIGAQGTGKGFFTDGLMRAILKEYYCRLDKPGVLKERFNTEQSRKFLTVLDEASWRGDHELANVMKSLTGNDTMTVEEKFGGRYTIENFSRYIITSNDIESVFIETTNRRYLVFEVSAKEKDNIGYYSTLYDQLRNEKLAEKFFDYLLKVDISNFNPKKFPAELDTEGDNTKISSMGAVGNFWVDLLVNNPIPLFHQGKFLKKERLFEMFLAFSEQTRQWQKGFSRTKFWYETLRLVPILKDRGRRFRDETSRWYGFEIDPYSFMKSFCETNRVKMPDDFDELALIAQDQDNDF